MTFCGRRLDALRTGASLIVVGAPARVVAAHLSLLLCLFTSSVLPFQTALRYLSFRLTRSLGPLRFWKKISNLGVWLAQPIGSAFVFCPPNSLTYPLCAMCTPGQIHDKRHLQEWLRAKEWQTHSRRSLGPQRDRMFSTSACVHIKA